MLPILDLNFLIEVAYITGLQFILLSKLFPESAVNYGDDNDIINSKNNLSGSTYFISNQTTYSSSLTYEMPEQKKNEKKKEAINL